MSRPVEATCSQCGHKGEIGFTDVFSDVGLLRLAAWFLLYEAVATERDQEVIQADRDLYEEISHEYAERLRTGQPASERRL